MHLDYSIEMFKQSYSKAKCTQPEPITCFSYIAPELQVASDKNLQPSP